MLLISRIIQKIDSPIQEVTCEIQSSNAHVIEKKWTITQYNDVKKNRAFLIYYMRKTRSFFHFLEGNEICVFYLYKEDY